VGGRDIRLVRKNTTTGRFTEESIVIVLEKETICDSNRKSPASIAYRGHEWPAGAEEAAIVQEKRRVASKNGK